MFLRANITIVAVLAVLLSASLAWTQSPTETAEARDLRIFRRQVSGLVWVGADGRPTEVARSVIHHLLAADVDGLEPSDYDAHDLARQAEALGTSRNPSTDALAEFDAGLTSAALKFLREIHLGRAEPDPLGFHLAHWEETHDFVSNLYSVVHGASFDRVVEALRPPYVQYRGLREALPAYRIASPARARQIELALERLRWLPDLTGQRLVAVNVPMFRLWAWSADRKDGVPAIEMAAIAGRAEVTETPIFSARMTAVVLNPSWTVPASIVRNEILPAIERNPRYLAEHHMEIVGDGSVPRIRQAPGPWNALGQIKFELPNVHSVYLHGTPDGALFARSRRDFSHGCIRLEDPLALAAWVFHGDEWPASRIRTAIAEGTTRVIRVRQPVSVVVFYMTAAFSPAERRIHFSEDVYGHDARLEAWLRDRRSRGLSRPSAK